MTGGGSAIALRITGRVQGVWYRGWMVEQARELGLGGWVRNHRDGSVEALVSGSAAGLAEMLRRCRTGPPGARVDHVSQTPAASPAGDGFHQLPELNS